jgi:hypothetical protein
MCLTKAYRTNEIDSNHLPGNPTLQKLVHKSFQMNKSVNIGMDVHKESISIAVMNGAGYYVPECFAVRPNQALRSPRWRGRDLRT